MNYDHERGCTMARYIFSDSYAATVLPIIREIHREISRPARLFEELAVPAGRRPRGAAAANRAPHSKFDRHHAPTADHRPRQAPRAMPVLSNSNASRVAAEKFVTQ
jgi:hypothetical protein